MPGEDIVRRVLLTVRYDGSRYSGFQIQPNGITVQQVLQDAAAAVFGDRYGITGCSRTDAGVHALAFYCTVDLTAAAHRVPAERVADAMNRYLPSDVSVTAARDVPGDFHPRYSAVSKEYIYLIHNSRIPDPFLVNRAYRFPSPLDAGVMHDAAQALKGTHDFRGFMAAGSSVIPGEGRGTIRTVKEISVIREGELIRLTISADGFLYNMVRIIVGTLIELSLGRIPPESLSAVLESGDRSLAGSTVPPQGLYLSSVDYGGLPDN